MEAAQDSTAPPLLWIPALKVWLANRVVQSIFEQASLMAPSETGGALMGWRNEGEVVVTGLVGPGPLARHERFNFYPDHQWQVAQLENAFRVSAGDLDYVGDWHSHPAGGATMSGEDRRTLARLSASAHTSIMLIAGMGFEPITLGCWTASRTGGLLARLRPRIRDCAVQLFDTPSHWPESFRIA